MTVLNRTCYATEPIRCWSKVDGTDLTDTRIRLRAVQTTRNLAILAACKVTVWSESWKTLKAKSRVRSIADLAARN